MASVVVVKDALHTPANPATPTVGVVTADEARLSQAASWARSATGVGARTGVVFAGTTALLGGTSTTAPSMTVTVAALHFVSQKAASEGVYVGSSPAVVVVDIAAAPGTYSRIDLVYAMQRDAGSPTAPDALTQAEIGVVTGVSNVTPSKPALPSGAVELGTVTVAAGATATTNGSVTVSTTARWTAPLGAPIPVRNGSERGALVPYRGLMVSRLDSDVVERYDGTVWRALVPDAGMWYLSEALGGGSLTTAWVEPATNASLTLLAGSYLLAVTANFSISAGANALIQCHLFDANGSPIGNDQQSSRYVGTNSLVGLDGFAAEFTRVATFATTTTVRLRTRTSATGGTQANSSVRLIAVRLGAAG